MRAQNARANLALRLCRAGTSSPNGCSERTFQGGGFRGRRASLRKPAATAAFAPEHERIHLGSQIRLQNPWTKRERERAGEVRGGLRKFTRVGRDPSGCAWP